jgi:hypothetical protein
LKAVHVLVKNSPSVNIVCGLLSCATKEIPRAGASAIWSGQDSMVFVQENSSVRFSVFSRGVCIGYRILECREILDCSPDLAGNRESFFTICDEDEKITGKLKITFLVETVESFAPPPLAFDTSQLRKGLEPPIIVTVHTLSMINMRSVHRFGPNSPLVKATCGNWRGATPVQNYAGQNAKWRDVNWTYVMEKDMPFKIVVQSGTVVIAGKTFTPEDLLAVFPNNLGLCEVVGQLVDSEGRTYEAGQLRMTYSYEAHTEGSEVHSDSDSDDYNEFGNVANRVLISTASQVENPLVKKTIGNIHIMSIKLTDLASAHAVSLNSPFLKIRCDDYRAVTSVSDIYNIFCFALF